MTPTTMPADQWEFVDAQTDPAPAGRHAVPHRRDLSARLQGGQPAGDRHRLCGDARPRLVPAPRRGRRRRHAPTRCARGGSRRSPARSRTAPRRADAICATSSTRGFNEDEVNRIVFDGINPARRDRAASFSTTASPAQPHRAGRPRLHVLPGRDLPVRLRDADRSVHRHRATACSRAARRAATARSSSTPSAAPNTGRRGQSLVTTDPLGQRDSDAARATCASITSPARTTPATAAHAEGRVRDAARTAPTTGRCCAPRSSRSTAGSRTASPPPREPLSAHRRRHAGGIGRRRPARSPASRLAKGPNPAARASTTAPTSTRASSARRCRSRSRTATACWCRRSTPTATRSRGLRAARHRGADRHRDGLERARSRTRRRRRRAVLSRRLVPAVRQDQGRARGHARTRGPRSRSATRTPPTTPNA